MSREFVCGRCGKAYPWMARAGADMEQVELLSASVTVSYYCQHCRWKKKANRTITVTQIVEQDYVEEDGRPAGVDSLAEARYRRDQEAG